jgi:hypothetical protein
VKVCYAMQSPWSPFDAAGGPVARVLLSSVGVSLEAYVMTTPRIAVAVAGLAPAADCIAALFDVRKAILGNDCDKLEPDAAVDLRLLEQR